MGGGDVMKTPSSTAAYQH